MVPDTEMNEGTKGVFSQPQHQKLPVRKLDRSTASKQATRAPVHTHPNVNPTLQTGTLYSLTQQAGTPSLQQVLATQRANTIGEGAITENDYLFYLSTGFYPERDLGNVQVEVRTCIAFPGTAATESGSVTSVQAQEVRTLPHLIRIGEQLLPRAFEWFGRMPPAIFDISRLTIRAFDSYGDGQGQWRPITSKAPYTDWFNKNAKRARARILRTSFTYVEPANPAA